MRTEDASGFNQCALGFMFVRQTETVVLSGAAVGRVGGLCLCH
jgi:hypothetical protein